MSYFEDARVGLAARAHQDADPGPKRTAMVCNVTPRTVRRWRNPLDANGSPNHRLALYVDTCPNPDRLLAFVRSLLEKQVAAMSTPDLIAEMRERYALNSQIEGEGNASRMKRGIGALDRAALHERNAASDEWLSAAWRECAARRLTDKEVLGS